MIPQIHTYLSNSTTFSYDQRDAANLAFLTGRFSGTFAFDTNSNQLLDFSVFRGFALDFDSTSGFENSPYASALAVFNAAGVCDLQCFIGALNTGSYSVQYTANQYRLSFGDPLEGGIYGFGPGGSGRQFNVAGTVRVTGSIPETATWAMMLMGFGAIGFAMRRRPAGSRLTQAT